MKLIWKILIPLLITIITIDVVLVSQNISNKTKSLNEKHAFELESHYKMITTFMKSQENKLLALAIQTANSSEIQRAIAEEDRTLLNQLIKPSYMQLKKASLCVWYVSCIISLVFAFWITTNFIF